ncbi:tetratricopeptide repeat protein [Winogradskyella sp. DF17]|uniref:Tetratricopeptide repeat protein n=1 Tax=Winogradskyella pelagia TaxID=2819984 RepID=A0ABS3T3F1_9FLAO|nr:tetratricopeptide repeat protein [Winogradskyella sp. DF17]MBO3117273.1 tetratricopeptide repeat protein [Winogradskyella sp. DF17]
MLRYLIPFFIVSFSFSQTVIDNAEMLMDKKQYGIAEEQITEYLQQNPKDLRAVELLGDAYGYQRQWDKAIGKYEFLVKEQPNSANYNYKFGGALAMKAQSVSKFKALGLIGDMKRAFLKTVALDSTHIDAHWALVDYYVTLPGIVGGSYSKALKFADKLQAISPVDGYLAKGYVYEYDDEPELAEKYYRQAIKVGGSITCYNKLSGFYSRQKKPEKAIGNFEQAQKKIQRNALHYQIGKVCADYNIQLDKGEKCLNTYLENFSAKDGVPKEWAYYRLAQIYRHKGDKSKAMEYIDMALSIRSDFKQARIEKNLISNL